MMLKGLATLVLFLSAQIASPGQEGEADAVKLRARGLAYARTGQISEAIGAYWEAIEADPSLETPYLELSDILLAASLPDEASSVLQRARHLFPHSKVSDYNTLFYRLGNAYIRSGRLGPAADAMSQAANVVGDVPSDTIYKKLGDVRVDLIQFDEADAAYRRALDINPGNLSVYLALANLDVRRNRLGDALMEYEHVVSAAPRNVAARSGIAEVYFRQGRFADAASEAARALALDPSHRPAHYVRGQALLRLGKLKEGRSELQEYQSLEDQAPALNLESADIYALYAGGMARVAQGDYEGAIALFRRGIESHPEVEYFYLALGAALTRSGQHQDAAETYAAAMKKFSDDPRFREAYTREMEAVRNPQAER